jgi:hypothetical protein
VKLVFTRQQGKFDLLEITRADGSTARVDCPKQGMIPHDMVHYAVETVIAADGFLTRVAHGEGLGFTDGAAPSAEPVERLVEAMQADTWSNAGRSDVDELIALYRLSCEARGHPSLPVTADHIAAIRAEMTSLAARWAEVPVGGRLVLGFEPG